MAEKANMAVKLDQHLRTRLQALGEAKRRTPHWLMCEAIRLYVEREEQEERERAIAETRLTHYDATGEYVDHVDMKEWLLLLGTDKELPPPRVRIDKAIAKKGKR